MRDDQFFGAIFLMVIIGCIGGLLSLGIGLLVLDSIKQAIGLGIVSCIISGICGFFVGIQLSE